MDANSTASTLTGKLPDLPYLHMGSGFMIGLAVGYFLKKSFKLLLLLLGIALVLMFVLEHYGIVAINETGLEHTVSAGTSAFREFGTFLKERLDEFGFAGSASAIGGFAVGLKIG
ncbi:FUN14 domain-containing protein [Hydrogenimonas urashimensis]|uniref:FUN14 domain-containing protein n=1 Tax=Hydrogenimonas urashimensis TaxID=2740515 RepID=UPI0019163615|nr:FUN14 domain-containing protein [Hydrogenimonas urashimensis]